MNVTISQESQITPTSRVKRKYRGCDLIIEHLREESVKYIFGITGKTISPIFDAALDFPDIQTLTTAHECGAAFMAYGYAQASRSLGVCCATTGGGITNLVTGVASAFVNSLPVLVITGQVPSHQFGKNAFQESTGYGRSTDAVTLFRSISKDSFMITSPERVGRSLEYAIRLAKSGRQGPVHINIPLDIQLAPITQKDRPQKKQFMSQNLPGCSQEVLLKALKLIQLSTRPVIIMGWGAVFSQGNKALIKLAELLNIPIVTTVQGKGGISSNHPLCLGVLGIGGHTTAKDYVFKNSDLIIAVGTSLGEFNTLGWNPKIQGNGSFIQIDIDPTEIGKNYSVDIGLVGDAKVILLQLLSIVKKRVISPKKNLPVKEKRTFWDLCINPEKTTSRATPILPQTLIRIIRENTPDDSVFLGDSSAHWAWVNHYMPILDNGMYYPTQGLGSMGTGIAASIGIKLVHPNKPVICVCGDGSFLMHGNEVATAVHYKINVIWIIMNDYKYAMPFVGTERLYGKGRADQSCLLPKINFAQMALSMGAEGYRVNDPDSFTNALKKSLQAQGPVVIDVEINTDEVPPIAERINYG